ncbi:hypothetical protein Tco_1448693, partial [Tanacetum coccineum]
MLDYGFNFMNIKIYIDNESTICIVKYLVFHSKTNHIEIRYHFIRDSYEKWLIQVIKIYTDHNVVDLLIKAFDVSSDEFGVKTGSCKVNATRQDLVLLGENLKFVDQHNMVACLERIEGNADFHQIVDFLNASTIRFQVTPKVSHLNAMKKIFRYLKGQPKLGLWYPRDSPFDLEAFSDSDYAGASLDRKSTTGGFNFLQKVDFMAMFLEILHKTVNDVKQIHATVDGKTVVISESSVRSDLHFNDEDGITCLTNDAIFENLTLMEYESDSNKLTFQKTLFSPQWKYIIHTILHCLSLKSTWNESSTNIASRVICLANGQKVNFSKLIFDAPATAQPRIEEQIPVTESSSPQNTQTPRQALQEDTHLPQTSVPIPNVAYEDVFKEWDDRVVRATTTTASLDATHASRGNTPGSDEERLEQDDLMDFVPPTPHDSPLSGGHTPGSDEGRPNINELMAICTNMSNRVLALEQSKTAQDLVIRKLKKKGRKSDKTKPIFDDSDFVELDVDNAMENVEGDAETQGRNIVKQITTLKDTVNTASIDVSVAEPLNVSTAGPSTSTVGDIFKDEMMTITDTLVAIRSIRPRTTSVIIHDVEEEPRGQLQPTAQPSSKDKGKALMREQRITREKATEQEAKDDALIEQMEDIQARVDADELLVERIQQEEREQFTIEEKSRMLAEMIVERKRFFAAQRAEQIRNKPPTRAQLRNKMKLYEREKKWINDFVPMDSELEVQRLKRAGQEVLDEPVKRQKIGEASGSGEEQSAKKEKELLEEELQKLLVIVPVEEVYVKALQVKYLIIDREVELKRLFEPDNDDTLWKLQ